MQSELVFIQLLMFVLYVLIIPFYSIPCLIDIYIYKLTSHSIDKRMYQPSIVVYCDIAFVCPLLSAGHVLIYMYSYDTLQTNHSVDIILFIRYTMNVLKMIKQTIL